MIATFLLILSTTSVFFSVPTSRSVNAQTHKVSTIVLGKWTVAKGEKKRIVAPNSKNSYEVTVTEGEVIVMEGDMAHPTEGDGKTKLKANETQSFTPGTNELYVIGVSDSANGTYQAEPR